MDGNSNINEIIINDENKFDYFLKKLDSINFSGKSYKLVVVTCYFNVSSINKLIQDVDQILEAKEIHLTEIELFLDKTQFYIEYSLNPQELQEKIVNHFKGRVTFKIPKKSQLFHPKAYCLMPTNMLPDDINIGFAKGGLFFGSANLSEKGFGRSKSSPNQELMYFTVDGKIISDFYNKLLCIETYNTKSLEEFDKIIKEESTTEENSLYKWRLIKEGNLVYLKSQGTIEHNLEISYEYKKGEKNTPENNMNKSGKAYYFFDSDNADDSKSAKKISENSVVNFKQSNEYREILDIFLRHNPTHEVDWGVCGINIFGNYYWLPKTLTDYLKDECQVLINEIEPLFNNNNVFFPTPTDLHKSAVTKMTNYLETNWHNLSTTWKEKVFEKIECIDLDKCDKTEIAQFWLNRKIKNFLKFLPEICKKYKLDDVREVDLIQKLRPNHESESSALLDYIYKQITQEKKDTWLGKCIGKAVSSTLKLEYIQLPHINRIDFLTENQLGRLIEAHIRYWLRSWLVNFKNTVENGKEKQSIKNEEACSRLPLLYKDGNKAGIKAGIKLGEVIKIEKKHESKVFNLKIFIISKTEIIVRDEVENIIQNQPKNWGNLIFIFRSNEENLYREMEVYQEGKSVSCKVPITDEIEEEEKEMRFLYEIKKIFESNFPVKPT